MLWLKRTSIVLLALVVLLAALGAWFTQDRPAVPAVGERVLIDGPAGALVYHRLGSGPAVLLLPSFARSASDFNALVTTLASAGFQTLALQPRGIEGSALGPLNADLHDFAADVVAVLQAENISCARAIIGHAYGNRVARVFAVDYPQRVGALILFASGGQAPPPPDINEAIRVAVFGRNETQRFSAIQHAFFAPGNVPPDSWLSGWYPRSALLQSRATAALDYSLWSHGGSTPMLVLQPADDLPAPPAQSAQLAQTYPDRVQRHIIAGAGHALLPEQPDAVARLTLDYLATIACED